MIATWARLGLALGIALGIAPAAGSPAAGSAAAAASFPNLEIWLDRPLPADGAPGGTIRLGALVWDRVLDQPIPGMPVSVRIAGAAAGASASVDPVASRGPGEVVRAVEDWPGHVTFELTAPAGGLDGLEFGIVGSVCLNDACREEFETIAVAGTGPPSDATLPALAEVTVRVMSPAPAAGQPVELEVVLVPRVDWDPSLFEPPASLQVELRRQRGPVVDDAAFALADPVARRYAGSLLATEPGDYVVQVATVGADGRVAVFGGSATRVTVTGDGDGAAGRADAAAVGGPLEPWVVPVVAIVVVSLGGLILLARRLDF